jgi:hypothetical protein
MEISKMNYRDMLGFPKKLKKKVEKKIAPKPTAPPVTELLKKEFGPLNEWGKVNPGPKRWTKKMDGGGLTEFERKGGKDNVNEGPAYEYARSTKNIEKSWKNTHKAVMGLVKELQKKGLKEEAFKIEKLIERVWSEFDHFFEETMDKLQ